MKTKYFFLAAIAGMTLVSCSNDEYIGDNSPTLGEGNGAIGFSMNTPTLTRATQNHTTSAATLNNQFIVWGEKSNAAETKDAGTPVFINYVVNYVASTAHTTESNSTDWEYVAQDPYAAAKVTSTGAPATVSLQTIKYWDFTNKYYTFTAISALPTDISGGKVKVTKNVSGSTTAYEKGYTVELKSDASIDKIYFSDRTPVVAADGTKSTPVTLNFRNLVSQVRFGFYETIPGYSVKITDVKFNSASHTADGADKFGVDCAGAVLVPGASTSFTVTYDDGSVIPANQNKAKVAVAGSNTQDYLSTTATSFFGTTLGTTSNARTFENGGDYTKILPNPSNTTDLTLTISYRLTSIDGSNETIDITDATAKVPAAYAKWQSNYAYTYLFKISDNTNGSSGQDIVGLYPITFDAVVITDVAGDQETITTVSDPSITTYAKGVNPTVASTAEYPTGKNIYVVVDKSGTVQTLTVGTNAKLYTADIEDGAAQGITEETVKNALAVNSDGYDLGTALAVSSDLTGYYEFNGSAYVAATTPADGVIKYYKPVAGSVKDANGKKLVVKAADGLSAITEIAASDSPTGVAIAVNGAKFAPAAAGTYVVEFTDSDTKKYYKVVKVVAAP